MKGAHERDRLYHYAKGVGGSDQKEPGQPVVEGARLPEEDG